MSKIKVPSKAVATLYSNVKQVIEEARKTVYRVANFATVQAYWHIGKLIMEEEQCGEQRAAYGELLIEELAVRLTSEYGKGFDRTNVWNMRKFFNVFPILDALRQELGWSHYITGCLRVDRGDGVPLNIFLSQRAIRPFSGISWRSLILFGVKF